MGTKKRPRRCAHPTKAGGQCPNGPAKDGPDPDKVWRCHAHRKMADETPIERADVEVEALKPLLNADLNTKDGTMGAYGKLLEAIATGDVKSTTAAAARGVLKDVLTEHRLAAGKNKGKGTRVVFAMAGPVPKGEAVPDGMAHYEKFEDLPDGFE